MVSSRTRRRIAWALLLGDLAKNLFTSVVYVLADVVSEKKD